jgi:hypothetical protein
LPEITPHNAKILAAKQKYNDAEAKMAELSAALLAAKEAFTQLDAAQKACQEKYDAAVQSGLNQEPEEQQTEKQKAYALAVHRVEVLLGVYAARVEALKAKHAEAKAARAAADSEAGEALNAVESLMQPPDGGGGAAVFPSLPAGPLGPLPAGGFIFAGLPAIAPRRMADNSIDADFKRVDAFWKLPLVKDAPMAENLDYSDHPADEILGEEPTREFMVDYRFDMPAHFPLPTYGSAGERINNKGLLIYEGMRLAIRDDGRYQIRFVAGTPAMPVEMELQFLLRDMRGRHFTVTLPPIRIPEKSKPKHLSERRRVPPVYSEIQTVHHEGYLPAFDEQWKHLTIVRRSGTARFGFGVDVP